MLMGPHLIVNAMVQLSKSYPPMSRMPVLTHKWVNSVAIINAVSFRH